MIAEERETECSLARFGLYRGKSAHDRLSTFLLMVWSEWTLVQPGALTKRFFLRFKVLIGARFHTAVLSPEVVGRLVLRYAQSNNLPVQLNVDGKIALNEVTPHQQQLFQVDLQRFMGAKVMSSLSSLAGTMYTVTPSLYESLHAISPLDCELFADGLNESGVFSSFCSVDSTDLRFGSAGKWEEVEQTIVSGAGNPPYDKGFIDKMIDAFESGVSSHRPYYRAVLLPGAPSYGVEKNCRSCLLAGSFA